MRFSRSIAAVAAHALAVRVDDFRPGQFKFIGELARQKNAWRDFLNTCLSGCHTQQKWMPFFRPEVGCRPGFRYRQ